MQYPDMQEYITFLFSLLDDFFSTQERFAKEENRKLIAMPPSSSFMLLSPSKVSHQCVHNETGSFIIRTCYHGIRSVCKQ